VTRVLPALTSGERTHDPLLHKSDFNRRIEIPPFDGTDTSGWLVRIDWYFRVSSIPVGEKLEYVVLALHGEALTWFEWWESQSTFHTWLRFKQDLLKLFEPGTTSNPLAPLLKVKQTGLVMEYRRDFELAARSHRHLGNDTLLCQFHEGLKPTIKLEIAVDEFENLQGMMDRAMVLEARNLAWKEEGAQPWGMSGDSNSRLGWGGSRTYNWARPNLQNLTKDVSKPNHNSFIKGDVQVESSPPTNANTSGSK